MTTWPRAWQNASARLNASPVYCGAVDVMFCISRHVNIGLFCVCPVSQVPTARKPAILRFVLKVPSPTDSAFCPEKSLPLPCVLEFAMSDSRPLRPAVDQSGPAARLTAPAHPASLAKPGPTFAGRAGARDPRHSERCGGEDFTLRPCLASAVWVE